MKFVTSALLGVVVVWSSGCVAVASAGVVGIGVVQYQRNEVEQDFPTDLTRTWGASLEGMRRLGYESPQTELGPTEGRIEQDDLVVVVERHADGFTRVRVRAGTFHTGDHIRRAQLVLLEIQKSIEQVDELREWSERVKELSPTTEGSSGSEPE